MALFELRDALLCASHTAAESIASALRHLWEYGIKEHSAGVRAWHGRNFWAAAAISGAALRTVQAQIFFGAAEDADGSGVKRQAAAVPHRYHFPSTFNPLRST